MVPQLLVQVFGTSRYGVEGFRRVSASGHVSSLVASDLVLWIKLAGNRPWTAGVCAAFVQGSAFPVLKAQDV